MRLDLRLTYISLDQLWCQAVVAFLYEGSPLKRNISRINENLAGSLIPLIDKHFLTGKQDELILIAPQGRIKADKLLLVGLGPIGRYSSKILSSVMRNVSSTLERLKLHEFGIMVPSGKKMKPDYMELIKAILGNLVDCYIMSKGDAVDFSLKVIVSIEERFLVDLQSLEEELRIYLDPIMDYSIVIDNNEGSENEKV
jgi:hypothetical protein